MIQPRQAGRLLVIGLLPLLVLVLHPTSSDLAHDPHGRMVAVNHLVHGLAVASMPLLVVGLGGLWMELGRSVSATLAFVTYVLATICNLVAAMMSGFVAPRLIARGSGDATTLLLGYTHDVNQAFATTAVVAAGVAFVLWGWALFRHPSRSPFLAAVGAIVGCVLVVGSLSGLLRLDVTGILTVTALQAAWLLPVAWRLLHRPDVT